MVAEDGVLVSVELSGGHLGGGSHACGVGDTLGGGNRNTDSKTTRKFPTAGVGRGIGDPFVIILELCCGSTNDLHCCCVWKN